MSNEKNDSARCYRLSACLGCPDCKEATCEYCMFPYALAEELGGLDAAMFNLLKQEGEYTKLEKRLDNIAANWTTFCEGKADSSGRIYSIENNPDGYARTFRPYRYGGINGEIKILVGVVGPKDIPWTPTDKGDEICTLWREWNEMAKLLAPLRNRVDDALSSIRRSSEERARAALKLAGGL